MSVEDDQGNSPKGLDIEDEPGSSPKEFDDIDKLRKPWEIEDHWILRRDFLLIHKKRFSRERLLCMAQIFVNVETLGAGYGAEIMEELKELTDEIPSLEEFRKKKTDLEAGKQFMPPPKKIRTDFNNRNNNNYGSGYNNRGGYNYGGGYNNRGGYNQGYSRGGGWSSSGRGRQY